MKPLPTEREIQKSVVDYARLTGWTIWELLLGSKGNGAVYCSPGLPDLYIFRPGCVLWVELKRGTLGRISPAQHERHAELRQAGLPVHVCRSFDEARELLDTHRRTA